MRMTTALSIAVGAIALTVLAPAPRASAMPAAAPAVFDTIAPNNGHVERVRFRRVCERYRYWRHGRWHYRTRCHRVRHRGWRHRHRAYRYEPYRYSGPGFYFGFR